MDSRSDAKPSIRVLGQVAIERDGVTTVLRGQAAKTLTLLVAHYPGAVTSDAIIDMLWGDGPAADVQNSLRVLLHRLRKMLGSPESVLFIASSYQLQIEPDEIDSVLFQRLASAADPDQNQLETALSLWQGTTAGGEPSDYLRSWQAHLETLRLDIEERRVDLLLLNGEAAEAAITARQLVGAQPFREERWQQLMLALYRSGRQQDALAAAAELTGLLRSELGVESGPTLRALEFDILQQAPHLDHRPALDPALQPIPLLPAPIPDGLVGRADEQAFVTSSLSTHQVATISGAGGIGKTALALTVAHALDRAETEVWWCDLTSARGDDVAFRIGVAAGVRNGTRDTGDIAESLSHRGNVLLVLDNCEHLVDEVRSTVESLCSASNVTVLATSRRPLDARGEIVVRLDPLPIQEQATHLFTRVARNVQPAITLDAELVHRICDRLDGLPLAIQLAALRLRSFTLHEIDAHLNRLLHRADTTDEDSERHATMTNAIRWSTDLLSPAALRCLGSAAVFPSSFDLQAFEAVAASQAHPDILTVFEELIDHGLVQVTPTDDRSRYRLLQPIRHFAATHLAQDLADDRDRHLRHYLERLDAAYEHQATRSSDPLWSLIANEIENFAAVHQWALASGQLDEDLRLYRPLNIAHLYDRPEPFLWAQDTLTAPGIVDCDHHVDALQAAWYGALAIRLDIPAAVALVEKLAIVGADDPSYDLALLARALHELVVNRNHDGASELFESVPVLDPYVRYVVSSVGASVRVRQALRLGTDATAERDRASHILRESLTWARQVGATNFEAGLLEQLAQNLVGAAPSDEVRDLANQARLGAAEQLMVHVEAQAEFQLVRCDLFQGRTDADTAHQMADVLTTGIRASAQARLRWQLSAAAELLAANHRSEAACLCLAVGGFAYVPHESTASLPAEALEQGRVRASEMTLLQVAAAAARELRQI